MSDQCQHCTVRGDIKACEELDCPRHEDWYVTTLSARIKELESRLALADRLAEAVEVFKRSCDFYSRSGDTKIAERVIGSGKMFNAVIEALAAYTAKEAPLG